MTESWAKPGPRNLITDVAGIEVGNAQDARVRTGSTVVLPAERLVAAVDVRGGAPGTRETDALDPSCLLGGTVDGVVLSGGSVYGLDAASGVVAWLGARGRGYTLRASPTPAPIVPAAILFDLANGGDKEWGETPPYNNLGRAACVAAGADFPLGNAGAGFGARAGAFKGGLGSASIVTAEGFEVGALMAANSFGSVVVPGTDSFWAAPFELDGELGGQNWVKAAGIAGLDPLGGSKAPAYPGDAAPGGPDGGRQNTTIGVVAVNAALTAGEVKRIATMAHNGLARAVRPAHTPVDGEVIFALATGRQRLPDEQRPLALARLGALAADCVARAVARGVYEADSLGEAVSYRETFGR